MFRNLIGVLITGLLLAACGSDLDRPSSDAVKARLLEVLPASISIDSIDHQISSNVGSEVEPTIESRYEVVLETDEVFVEVEGRFGDVLIFSEAHDDGTEFKLLLVTSANLSASGWDIDIKSTDIQPRIKGEAISRYQEREYVFYDTDEYKIAERKYQEELARLEQERIAREKARAEAAAAEKRRKAAEASEARRQAQLKLVADINNLSGNWVTDSVPHQARFKNRKRLTRDEYTSGLSGTIEKATGVSITIPTVSHYNRLIQENRSTWGLPEKAQVQIFMHYEPWIQSQVFEAPLIYDQS